MLIEEGSECVFVVQNQTVLERTSKLFPNSTFFTCDVEKEEEILELRKEVGENFDSFDGLLHSIAFADYSEGMKPFHETSKKAFLQALDISCFSLVEIARAFADLLKQNASVVTMSISTTRMASENYGYMAPIKAALDSSIAFLTKSFSSFSQIRFNAVAPSLLKTSASAGIPGYLDSYLFAEQAIPRKSPVQTEEAAAAVVFLLSPRSSGIVSQKIIVDAGMSTNYFDKQIIDKVVDVG
ncbi:MAG: SDR family oxidoreductase [Thermoguttaceae bacterium]|nr:SDR family oxidoreductase [Thermoguttaceae bacterium]